jgi:putative transposase
MPRKPREEVEGGVFHVFARGNDRQLVYRDDVDRRRYLAMLAVVVRRKCWRCLAYCLMENHVHLMLETPQANLAAGMRDLHGVYAQAFNARHRRVGHVFQGRYGAVRMRSDEQLWTAAAYVARNPVEAGLCAHADEWPWSSHRAVIGRAAPNWLDTGRLLSFFEAAGGDPRERYLELVAREGNGP